MLLPLLVSLQYDAKADLLYRFYLLFTVIGVFGGFIGIAALIWQTTVTRRAAEAAKASADSIINSERAWVFLDIALKGRVEHVQQHEPNITRIQASYRYRNVGRSPAWITELIFYAEIFDSGSLPKRPDIESFGPFEYGPLPFEAGGDKTCEQSWDVQGKPGSGKFTLVLGVIKYLDIFGKQRMTVCGYALSPDEKRLERIAGPGYNQYI
jgi:hypothetical protein